MKSIPLHQIRIAIMIVFFGVIFATGYIQKLVFKDSLPASASADNGNVNGFGWSDNIGWISFNSSSDNIDISAPSNAYGVNIDETGNFSGHAWSDNIGWVSFNRIETGNPPSTPFNGGAGSIAQVDLDTGVVTGWARAVSAVGRADGWDGWIKFSDDSFPGWNGKGTVVSIVTGSFSGYAWGSDVVGWIEMSAVKTPVPIGGGSGDPKECTEDKVDPATWSLCATTEPVCVAGVTQGSTTGLCPGVGSYTKGCTMNICPPGGGCSEGQTMKEGVCVNDVVVCPAGLSGDSCEHGNGVCDPGETVTTFPKDCRIKIQQF